MIVNFVFKNNEEMLLLKCKGVKGTEQSVLVFHPQSLSCTGNFQINPLAFVFKQVSFPLRGKVVVSGYAFFT